MKATPARYAPRKAEVICLVALSVAPLKREGRLYKFGHRFFSPRTVNKLVELGLAIRDGNKVRSQWR